MMRKIYYILICLLFGVISFLLYELLKNPLDYKKIVFVVPFRNDFAGNSTGDAFLINDLKKGFNKLGYVVEYRYLGKYEDLRLGDAGNVLYFLGYSDLTLALDNPDITEKRKKILYLYYPFNVNFENLKKVDIVVSASKKYAGYLFSEKDIIASYIPQFTNPYKFKESPSYDVFKSKILFIASNHTMKGRKSVDFSIKANIDLSLYGLLWDDIVPKKMLKGSFVENAELYIYYNSADIILNDHQNKMDDYGFISNRIYDVTASGGFLFTDYMPEIEEVYGDSVATYKNYDEFKEKIEYYLAHPEVRAEMAQKAREITLNNFTNDIAAQKFDTVFKSIKK